jgi:hypothetical protein
MEHNIHGALEEHICVTSTIVQILFFKECCQLENPSFHQNKSTNLLYYTLNHSEQLVLTYFF